jgi:GGDEF domain-containing protein
MGILEERAFRYGGDEFVAVLNCGLAGAEEIVQRIRDAALRENDRGLKSYRMRFSIGPLAYVPTRGSARKPYRLRLAKSCTKKSSHGSSARPD